MNRVLSNKRLYSSRFPSFREVNFVASEQKRELAGKMSLSVGIIFLMIFTLFLGGMYIFQVNKISTQGIDMRNAENRIKELEKEQRNLEIKEVQLKSMDQIEKAKEDFNLVESEVISFLELDGSMAMK